MKRYRMYHFDPEQNDLITFLIYCFAMAFVMIGVIITLYTAPYHDIEQASLVHTAQEP